jgi:copper chaperone NosL
MRPSTRALLAFAALLLAVAYVRPLWHIGLIAPQYPEGLGMYIWINTITGQKTHDLQNINGLNHYIGMQEIHPEMFPELRIMPALVGGLIGLGLLAALVGRRGLLYTWTGAFAALALAGLATFWRWGYQYGHNLDPTAAIKVPGMAYQPPLIGSKQLLNFYATSWPALAGWAMILSLALGATLSVREWRRHRRPRETPSPAVGAAVRLAA